MRLLVLVLVVVVMLLGKVHSYAKGRGGVLSRSWARNAVTSESTGAAGTTEFRVFFKGDGGKAISPWHDIPLKAGEYYNFINEIPKYVDRSHTQQGTLDLPAALPHSHRVCGLF